MDASTIVTEMTNDNNIKLLGIFGGVTFALIAAFLTLFYKTSRFLGTWSEKDKAISRIESSIEYLKTEIISIRVSLKFLENSSGASTTESKSPINLTKKGEILSQNIKAEELVKKNLKELMPSFLDLSNAYDVQDKAMKLGINIYEMLEPNEKEIIKTEAFNSGLPLSQIYPIFSIHLRDLIFSERKISISDLN